MAVDPLQNYLNSTQTYQADISSLDDKTAQVIQASKLPDSTNQMSAAQNLANTVNADVKPVANAMVSDLQSQINASQKQTENQATALQLKTDATQAYIQQSREAALAAVQQQKAFEEQQAKDVQGAVQSKEDMINQSKQVLTDFNTTIEKWSISGDDALVRDIENANMAMRAQSKAMERQIKESDPNWQTSPVYNNFKLEQAMAFQTAANSLISAARKKTQDMLQTGAAAAANIASAVTQNISWAHKYALDYQQAATAAMQQSQMQTMAYLDTQRALEMTGLEDLAAWYDMSPVNSIEAAGMMATILDLQLTSQAQAEAKAAAAKAQEQANQPNPKTSSVRINTPARWSSGGIKPDTVQRRTYSRQA